MKVCYPGTFDPVTLGHLDIIERASRQFDEVVVMINRNPAKHALFTEEERKSLIEKSLPSIGSPQNVSIVIASGLTVKAAEKLGCEAIIRGIRAVSDYEYELKQATANMMLAPHIETFIMIAKPEYSFLSSSVVKEIAMNHGDISKVVPPEIEKIIKDQYV